MSLPARLVQQFGSATRQRGDAYARQGRVKIESVSSTQIEAIVRGTRRYRVEVEADGAAIVASCTCPYFEEAMCKHLWAVLNCAEVQPLLQQASSQGAIKLLAGHDAFNEESDDYDDEVGDVVDADESRMPSARQSFGNRVSGNRPRVSDRAATRGWRQQLALLKSATPGHAVARDAWPAHRELLYVIDVVTSRNSGGLQVELFVHDQRRDGTWGKPRSQYLPRAVLNELSDPADRHNLALLSGITDRYGSVDYTGSYRYLAGSLDARYRLMGPLQQLTLPKICETGRCRVRLQIRDDEPQWLPVSWDDAEPWQFRLEVRPAVGKTGYTVSGVLARGTQRMPLADAILLTEGGVLLTRERATRYEHGGAFDWVTALRQSVSFSIPAAEVDEFVAELLRQSHLPPVDLPQELHYEEVRVQPVPRLTIKQGNTGGQAEQMQAELSFNYRDVVVAEDEAASAVVQKSSRHLLIRDQAVEQAAQRRLEQLGWRRGTPRHSNRRELKLSASRLPQILPLLLAEGWHVEAQGKPYRSPGKVELEIRSGIDWFELHGSVKYGKTVARLPELLAAARRGTGLVQLDDGSVGLLPQEWLQKYGLFAAAGTTHEKHLRFTRSQAGLIDALLASQPEAQCDAVFARVREQLHRFGGVQACDPPVGFNGELRPYQKEGLGWLKFLQQFGFGGCLADDMGLGKTIQVLALLETRRELRVQRQRKQRVPPSLVVMPKSLIFNWKQEAARFTPALRVLDHTGTVRRKGTEHFKEWDVILTTYGTLRRDAVDFNEMHFDYVILDEAQAIKNASSGAAKASRLLKASHRLAMSGTPIENHLGELWSLFEFLNPGMLGTAAIFKSFQSTTHSVDEGSRRILAQALRPFLLRRTKEQVATDLPQKFEQTLYCELESRQRKLYDELREHYRASLLKRIDSDGINRAKIQVLEALLRLRQAAIHPGLLDAQRTGDSSAKLDVLLPRLLEVIDEGHKVLVFSQFTAMLAILREHLDQSKIVYEYLDGKTRDRQARVERFQTDQQCKVFLVSLKAGGVGLNLTAAQYVFLLDPWWNPAVEAQAIDRAHRIGQTQQVFAYRLVARDTVEEKVLELQNTKRDLADAIINADNALLRNLGREDLELLLS